MLFWQLKEAWLEDSEDGGQAAADQRQPDSEPGLGPWRLFIYLFFNAQRY